MTDDFFNNQEDTEAPEATEELTEGAEPESEPEKIKIGEEEMTVAEAQELLKLGKLGREAEKKYNTKLENVWPDYGKTKNELKKLREEAEAKAKEVPAPQGSEEERTRQIKEEAKKYGLLTQEDFDQFYVQRRAAERLVDDCKRMEGEVDGKDGRPAFKMQDILEHMRETGIRDPMKAYKDKFETELDAWKEEQLKKAKQPGLVTERVTTAGNKEAKQPKITRDNFDEMVSSALRGEL